MNKNVVAIKVKTKKAAWLIEKLEISRWAPAILDTSEAWFSA